MVTKTEKDRKALADKAEHPSKKVTCPRCGNEIIYKEIGNSISVKCKTPGCIRGGIRGL